MTTRRAALADNTSVYYHNVNALIRRAMADHKNANNSRRKVLIPFKVPPASVAEYERRFGWRVETENHGHRSAHAPHVAGLAYCMAMRNLLCMGFDGEEVVMLDGDLPFAVAKGLTYAKVVRTSSSNRLQTGYALEELQLERLTKSGNAGVRGAAGATLADLRNGGGNRVFLNPQDARIRGDTVIVDHTRTSISLIQTVACATAWRAQMVRGVCFFQVEMLTHDEGALSAFPGRYYIDHDRDIVTYVPDEDPSTSFSHGWSALRSFFLNHECVYEGKTWLVEKHLGEVGVFHYAARLADEPWSFPSELGANYYSDDLTRWVELEYPTRGGVATGASSVYFRREKVRIMQSLYDKTMAVMMTVEPSRLTREEVLGVMRAYNNTSVVGGDTVRNPLRLSAHAANEAATPILAQVVFRRAKAQTECSHALAVLKRRYGLASEGLLSLFWEACCASATFLTDFSVLEVNANSSKELTDLVDGSVNMSVLARKVPTSIEVRRDVGKKQRADYGQMMPGMPGFKNNFLLTLLSRARQFSGLEGRVDQDVSHCDVEVSASGEVDAVNDNCEEVLERSGSVGEVADYVVTHTVVEPVNVAERTGLAKKLFDKLVAEQDAANFVRPPREIETYESVRELPPTEMSTIFSDYAGMQEDYDDGFPGISMSDPEIVAHVASTEDVEVSREAYMSINMSKQEVAKPKFVRRAKGRAGAAGVLPNTQSGLLAALGKRNVDVPMNRESVDFLREPARAVQAIVDNCYVDGWREILQRELDAGLWRPAQEDLANYVGKVDSSKAEAMLKEFFSTADINMHRWLVMTKGKAKPPVDAGADTKVPLPQTIMFNESKSFNAMFSSIMSRFHDVLDMLFLPNIKFNDRSSPMDHEVWFNTLQALRATCKTVYRYQGDSYNFDRSQELMAFSTELCFYRAHGLNEKTLNLWKQTMGVKTAVSLMHGVLMHIVLQGLSGIFKTLMRNGLVTLASVVVATRFTRQSLISLDVKGDDYTLETNVPIDVARATQTLAWKFNLSAKLWGCDYLYFCSKYWLHIDGWWYWVTDPERKYESLCAAVSVDSQGEDTLSEKWISLRDDLRHYSNAVVADELANAVLASNPRRVRPPLQLIGGLARLAEERDAFMSFYGPAERVGL